IDALAACLHWPGLVSAYFWAPTARARVTGLDCSGELGETRTGRRGTCAAAAEAVRLMSAKAMLSLRKGIDIGCSSSAVRTERTGRSRCRQHTLTEGTIFARRGGAPGYIPGVKSENTKR